MLEIKMTLFQFLTCVANTAFELYNTLLINQSDCNITAIVVQSCLSKVSLRNLTTIFTRHPFVVSKVIK